MVSSGARLGSTGVVTWVEFSDAARPREEEAAHNRRVLARQAIGVVECAELRAVVRRGLIIRERAFSVAARDARGLKELLLSILCTAAAAPRALPHYDFHPRPEAE